MKKLFQYFFCLLACLHLVGGPTSLVQVYAWASMIRDYSAEAGLAKGVADTFSGEKPCSLCCKIAEVKSAEDSEKEPLVPLIEVSKQLKDFIASSCLQDLKDPVAIDLPETHFASYLLSLGSSGSGPSPPPPRTFA